MKTGPIAIRRNLTRYNIFRKGHNGWANSARNIFNFTATLIEGDLCQLKYHLKKEAFKIELNRFE